MRKSPNRPSRLILIAVFTNSRANSRPTGTLARREHEEAFFGSDGLDDGDFFFGGGQWREDDLAVFGDLDVEAITGLCGPDRDAFFIVSYCSHCRRFPQLTSDFKWNELARKL